MNFLPHGHCYFWDPAILTMDIVANLLIAFSYFSLAYLLFKFSRVKSIPYSAFMFFFSCFILWCGFTHIMDIVVIWHPLYWAQGIVLSVTAFASVMTAYVLFKESETISKLLQIIRRHNERESEKR